MKVIFLEHVLHTGKPGDIKEVSGAYARNFLIPKWLVKECTPQMEKQLQHQLKKQESQRRSLKWDTQDIIKKLDGQMLNFSLNSGGSGKVFGSIWEKEIIAEIQKRFHISLTKKCVVFPSGHIKNIGEDFIYIKLWKNAVAKVNILVSTK